MANPAHKLGVPVQGEALIAALIEALAAIQTSAVGTAAGARATVIGDELTVDLTEAHTAEVVQNIDGTLGLKLVAI